MAAEATIWSARERARIERLCAVLSGDASAAADLAQETFLQAWRIRDRLVDESGASSWLDAIARNVCRRWRTEHGRRRHHETPTGTTPPEDSHDPLAELLEREELVDLLDRALGRLPADTRAALVGRYVEERLPAELAARLGTSPDALSMRLVRGRTRLRELLETELAEEPLAAVWRSRHGVAWRETRLTCPDCGRACVALRRDPDRGVVELRCAGCAPTSVAAAYRLDNPAFGALVREARRPSTVVLRMAEWNHGHWTAALRGPVPCTRCGAPVRATVYHRAGARDERNARGWEVVCPCGEALSTSLGGVVLALPETRALRRRRPRASAARSRPLTVAGRPALLVSFRDPVSGEGVDAVFDDATTRLVGVTTVR